MNDEGVVALLGLVLMTIEGNEVRIKPTTLEKGLPENSGVQVYKDELTEELVIKIQKFDDKEEDQDGQ